MALESGPSSDRPAVYTAKPLRGEGQEGHKIFTRRAGNDTKGRLWAILQTMKNALRRSGNDPTTELFFDVLVVRDRIQPSLTKLKVVAGPDDYGRPCLTIMFLEED